jgi:hypothetical protein
VRMVGSPNPFKAMESSLPDNVSKAWEWTWVMGAIAVYCDFGTAMNTSVLPAKALFRCWLDEVLTPFTVCIWPGLPPNRLSLGMAAAEPSKVELEYLGPNYNLRTSNAVQIGPIARFQVPHA